MDDLETLDRLEIKDQPVHQDRGEIQVNQGQRVNLDRLVILDLKDLQEQQEPQALPDRLGIQVQLDPPDSRVHKDSVGLMVFQGIQDQGVITAVLDRQELMVNLVSQGL